MEIDDFFVCPAEAIADSRIFPAVINALVLWETGEHSKARLAIIEVIESIASADEPLSQEKPWYSDNTIAKIKDLISMSLNMKMKFGLLTALFMYSYWASDSIYNWNSYVERLNQMGIEEGRDEIQVRRVTNVYTIKSN